MPPYVAMKLVDSRGSTLKLFKPFQTPIAHIHVQPDRLICSCIERFQLLCLFFLTPESLTLDPPPAEHLKP
jgi:hypothetical protein